LRLPAKIIYEFLISPPSHIILLNLITLIIFSEKYKYDVPYCTASSSLLLLPPLCTDILVSTIFSDTL
jgi:hypothetical protein